MLARQGAFEAGGKVIGGDKKSLSCDHGYMEYEIPVHARKVALFMWHSSSGAIISTARRAGSRSSSIESSSSRWSTNMVATPKSFTCLRSGSKETRTLRSRT
jgi:hypothetical protein